MVLTPTPASSVAAALRNFPRQPCGSIQRSMLTHCDPLCQCFMYTGNMDHNDAVQSLAALAQPLRLKVFRALVVTGQAGLTPGAMAEELGIPPNTLSFHLKELAHAGLVTQERASRNIIYRAAFAQMNALLGYLTENCCEGAACALEVDAACKC